MVIAVNPNVGDFVTDTSVIVVNKLTKFYGRAIGVRDISFAVEQGEIFGFLGPNGAGKTSTIRLMLDLLRPTAGEVRIFGRTVNPGTFDIRGRCGYLPGSFSAYGNMSGLDFLDYAAAMRRADPKLQTSLMDRFQLSRGDLSKKVKHLSLGMLQKIGIIQAFFHEPDLLILDEPTHGLDPLMQEAFYELLKEIQQAGRTIFFSSHNLAEVEKVCHRVAIIRSGELVALETLAGLKKKRLRRLEITLQHEVPDISLPGARLISHKDLHYKFLVEGEIQPLLGQLSELPVENLVFPEPDLEEVFMAYYHREDNP